MKAMSSWGRLTSAEHAVTMLNDPQQVAEMIGNQKGIVYGMGRSYGDVCLNPGGALWLSRGLDCFISFDPSNGRLVCESGVLLRDIQQFFIPQGWMLAVTPGTQFVTVGGAIANDVHGKNHHSAGSFGNHVRQITLIRTDGETIECGPKNNSPWFAATVGGLGLTGVIVKVELQLQRIASSWLETETIPCDLNDYFQLSDASAHWQYSVSWIDCVTKKRGRGIFMRANLSSEPRAEPKIKSKTIPVLPVSLVNRFTVRPFNHLYYHLQKSQAGKKNMHYQLFFYPLDNVQEWNRLYGPKGFYQYQSVVPNEVAREAITDMVQAIAKSKEGSFLSVLKTFGDIQSLGMLSFPRSGVTLALDFPNRGESTLKLFSQLDAIVMAAKGRIYPAKDARMPREVFEAGYPQLAEFLKYRDPGISSAMSRRLLGN